MSPKVLQRIVLALAVAVLAWGGLAFLRRGAVDRPERLVLPKVAADAAQSIAYVGPRDTIRLERQGAGWTVNGHPAAPRVVETFFRSLADTSVRADLVAQSVESHSRLGVDSAAGKHLTVSGGGKSLVDLWFGNRGPDFEGFYVRQAGDPRVFLLKGTFADLTVQPLEDWREKQVLALSTDSIARVEVTRGKQRYTLTRSGTAWSLAKGGAADSTRVTRWLALFRELRATSFPSPAQADSAKFAPAERTVTLYGSGGAPLASVALDSIASTFVMRVNDQADLYTLDQRMTDLVAPAESTLKK
ncbi:MAG TPA: DUF4340 domain-containing protein [Gemmatimonadales bacterium]|nr:DUF4340 domain-containing protein [Gemmatimonadales bacterium]